MHHEATAYIRALEQAANSRLKVIKYGESWEGRALYSLIIGSPSNLSRLEAVKAGMRRLADPRGVQHNEANSLINSLPSIVWLICGVHGNEISSVDAGLLIAYHLLASRNDALVEAVMKNSLVLIDPMQNPDGRDHFVNYFRQNVGRYPDPDMQAAEHNEVWPSGRVNHYLFDMNRDWFAQTQPETRGRTKFYLEWFPQVVADLHEMGTNNTYYFAPPALPWNPNFTKAQLEWLDKELAKSGSDWKIMFFHHPIYSSGERHGPSLQLRAMLEPLFVKHNVDLVLTGHEHFYERIKPQRGIYYFIVGSSAKLRAGNIAETDITAKGFDKDRAFMLMEVTPDRIYFQTLSRTGATVDSGTLDRRDSGRVTN